MNAYFDQRTGEYLGKPGCSILRGESITSDLLEKTLQKYILSVSGWRAIIAFSADENDPSPDAADEDIVLCALAAASFLRFLGKHRPRILVGRDARPTGAVLSEAAIRAFSGLGAEVSFAATSSAPEVMAYSNNGFDGFFYISASHNPIGHNGYKFGRNGGVLGSDDAKAVEVIFHDLISDQDWISRIIAFLKSTDGEDGILRASETVKRDSLSFYEDFVIKTAEAVPESVPGIGIVAEFNGSARSASIDVGFMRKHGIKVHSVNNVPGQVVHGIVPEGDNLELCRRTLEKMHEADPDFILGYVPDNDGDRGNLVYYSERNRRARILAAQQVFALIAMIEVAHQVIRGESRIAVAANGCTSYLADSAISQFGASVFRSDVGEANVVALAKSLRRKGFSVKVSGEGSNGGIIECPAKVRDPMNSIMTILKLYYVPGLYDLIAEMLRIKSKASLLEAVIEAMPAYTTTSAFSSNGVMHIDAGCFYDFKSEYERNFIVESKAMMEMHGFSSYKVFQMDGEREEEGMGEQHRDFPALGGYRIELFAGEERKAFLWFSKSRTEPLLRVMADVAGDDTELHDSLLEWHRRLICKSLGL